MKKILKIASYDFKRLVFNPITLVVFFVVLALCLISGIVYKIPTTPAYTAELSGSSARDLYTDFFSSSASKDTKNKLDATIESANDYIKAQRNCYDFYDLAQINTQFKSINNQLRLYKESPSGSCEYLTNNNIDPIILAANDLQDFVTKFQNMPEFHSNLVFKTSEFEDLEEMSEFFTAQANSNQNIRTILDKMYEHKDYIVRLNEITKEAENETWLVSSETLAEFESLIAYGKDKLITISDEMHRLYSDPSSLDKEKTNDMKSLATNYKLTCEIVKASIELQLKKMLQNHFGNIENLYGYESFDLQETDLALTKINHFLQDDSPYYRQPQQALNFNTASYEVSIYDHSYFIMSLVGLLVALFGIFCAYKLFGRDRKSGKMDIILSQNVTFSQVFAGKFLAIVYSTSFFLAVFLVVSLCWGFLFYSTLPNAIFAIFNLKTAYTIHPFLFLLIKVIGIELQAIFYSVLALFVMNLSRKFHLNFAISLCIFAIATVCNLFFNGSIVYCLFPFVHADLTSFLGGATMQTGFLRTSLYFNGNFFISLIYYLVVVVLFYNFTKNMFKKN